MQLAVTTQLNSNKNDVLLAWTLSTAHCLSSWGWSTVVFSQVHVCSAHWSSNRNGTPLLLYSHLVFYHSCLCSWWFHTSIQYKMVPFYSKLCLELIATPSAIGQFPYIFCISLLCTSLGLQDQINSKLRGFARSNSVHIHSHSCCYWLTVFFPQLNLIWAPNNSAKLKMELLKVQTPPTDLRWWSTTHFLFHLGNTLGWAHLPKLKSIWYCQKSAAAPPLLVNIPFFL